jgi:peptidoglycan/LPS O-acetylase OafA/YrhL
MGLRAEVWDTGYSGVAHSNVATAVDIPYKIETVVAEVPLAETKRFYVPVLDGIRAVAFGLVFVAHAGLDKVVPGGFGVTVFFFLSGYLITTLLRLEADRTGAISLKGFYIRRAFRILPPLYITIAFVAALGAAHILESPGRWQACLAAILSSFNYFKLLAPSHGGLPTGLGVVWSLAIEEHFYLLFPLVYMAFVRRRVAAKTQAAILLSSCLVALLWRVILVYGIHISLTVDPPWTYVATDCRFDAIAWGCLLAICNNPWFADRSPLLGKYRGYLALGGLATIVASLLIRNPAYRETFRYTIQSMALYPIFYYAVASPSAQIIRWLSWKPLRWIGWTSYSLYLIHDTILLKFESQFGVHVLKIGVICFILAALYAAVMRYAVENPLRKVRARFVTADA